MMISGGWVATEWWDVVLRWWMVGCGGDGWIRVDDRNGKKRIKFYDERVLKEKFGEEFTQKEMKYVFDNLKAKYVQTHKRARTLQSNPLPYPHLYEIVFQNVSANGDGQWTNTEQVFEASTFVSAASESGPSTSKT
ncbi:hypothetical protein Tco_0046603 [Tanacetum coccineum]